MTPEIRELWKHVKSGRVCIILGSATFQDSAGDRHLDERIAVIYWETEGARVWVRGLQEFCERFIRVEPQP